MNTTQAICRMREVIRRQHKALSIEDCYITRKTLQQIMDRLKCSWSDIFPAG